ncbi:hypothetical protein [Pseudodesulfovibrio sp.]|uniref:hypothetical protein n=1 Tax=Pseudodesulfovibrio sp. TaxID=2035812 RepID=UPI002632EAB3|nr:hypothetical protein [Pseudodesulfovibrio sp.]MDD3313191.1 hypothetical protein [Pseudodesulfovibrio sp.]
MLNDDQKKQLAVDIAARYAPEWSDTSPVLYVLHHDFGFSIRDIAKMLGIAHPNLSKWLNGLAQVPERHQIVLSELLKDSIEAAKSALDLLKLNKQLTESRYKTNRSGYDDPRRSYDVQIQMLENVIYRAEGVLLFS